MWFSNETDRSRLYIEIHPRAFGHFLQGRAAQDKLAELTHRRRLKSPIVADHVEIPLPHGADDLDDLHLQPQQHLPVGHHRDAEAVGHQTGNDLVLLRRCGAVRRSGQIVRRSRPAGRCPC